MIAGVRAGLAVNADDDHFHPVTVEDPSWIETAWFPFWIPERAITMHVRVVARPLAGTVVATVGGWQGAGERLDSRVYQEAFDPALDLADLRVGCLHLSTELPLRRYRIQADDDGLGLDVVFDAVMEPNPVHPDESPGMFLGHHEQPGRVSGQLVLAGETHPVDCGAVRDRSWGPRRPRPGLRLGNAFGTDPAGDAFFVYVNPGPDGAERITGGYLLRDGLAAAIVTGERSTTWRDGLPAVIGLEATDALGRRLLANGRCRNVQAADAGNDVYAVINLVAWDADGWTIPLWGENHDVWSASDWIAAGRSPLGGGH